MVAERQMAGCYIGLTSSKANLHSRVDLNEIISVLLIDQELGSACIAIVDRLGKLDGIIQDGLTHVQRQIFGRSQLHDLLVTTLHAAVSLVQVDDIAEVVA